MNLDQVARDAGYTRGALYHQFANKEELAAAVVDWIEETWDAEVGHLLTEEGDPVDALFAVARGHALYCRRDIAHAMRALETEFPDSNHPIGAAVSRVIDRLLVRCEDLVATAQRTGRVLPSPAAGDIARAIIGALEAVVIELSGRAPFDADLAERAVRGLLGLGPAAEDSDPKRDD